VHIRVVILTRLVLLACIATAACSTSEQQPVQSGRPVNEFDPAAWQPPAEADIPADSLGASIRRGLVLVTHTPDSLPAYAPGRISCTNCHLNSGRNVDAAPLTGSFVRYPRYLSRTGAVVGITDRVNYCFTRSLGGTRLPAESREMQDIVAYLAFLSRGIPVGMGDRIPGGSGIPSIGATRVGDTTTGAVVYGAKCASCHGADGGGNLAMTPRVPALWGPKSFAVGASMARGGKAADFIWHNMPWGAGKTLTKDEAIDVAAYMTSRPRLDSPGKNGDWPYGGAPADVPYKTAGREAYRTPPLLPRANAAGSLVPAPPSVHRRGDR
jgi:thiosulfate dehydrogenase